jgi:uridine phosphorylase
MGEFPGNPLPYAHELAMGHANVGVIARCGWGGPQTAILVEELAYIGVTKIIGIGAVGSIDPAIPKGSQVVAQVALTSDGTSKAYTDAPELKGDAQLCSLSLAAGEKLSTAVRMVCAVTTDALYRETEAEVEAWRKQGAQVVNMETSALYAVSATCGISSVWLGHVSDCLGGREWEEWTDIEDMTVMSAKLGLEILIEMHSPAVAENDGA